MYLGVGTSLQLVKELNCCVYMNVGGGSRGAGEKYIGALDDFIPPPPPPEMHKEPWKSKIEPLKIPRLQCNLSLFNIPDLSNEMWKVYVFIEAPQILFLFPWRGERMLMIRPTSLFDLSTSERPVPGERLPNFNFNPASHFQSGASSQNNPTHGHTLWIAMWV